MTKLDILILVLIIILYYLGEITYTNEKSKYKKESKKIKFKKVKEEKEMKNNKDLKLKVGDKVIFNNGMCEIVNGWDGKTVDYFKNYRDGVKKVLRPKYKTIYDKSKENLLDEVEKEYLNAVIKPFRDRVKYIEKRKEIMGDSQYIFIKLDGDTATLPYFAKYTIYKGMKLGKEYTLKELGLDE